MSNDGDFTGTELTPDGVISSFAHRELTTLDGVDIPEDATALNLSENCLSVLQSEWFPAGLTFLYLEENDIKSIAGITFPPTLLDLSLSNNLIETLAGATFPEGLEELWLDGNRLTSLKDAQFPPALTTLDIERNESLTGLSDAVFPPRLNILYADGLQIKDLDAVTFPDSLVGIYIANLWDTRKSSCLQGVRWPCSLTELRINLSSLKYGIELPETLPIVRVVSGLGERCQLGEIYLSPSTDIPFNIHSASIHEASSATCARRLLTLPPPIDPLPVQAWVARVSYLLGGVTWQMVEDAIYKKNDDNIYLGKYSDT